MKNYTETHTVQQVAEQVTEMKQQGKTEEQIYEFLTKWGKGKMEETVTDTLAVIVSSCIGYFIAMIIWNLFLTLFRRVNLVKKVNMLFQNVKRGKNCFDKKINATNKITNNKKPR